MGIFKWARIAINRRAGNKFEPGRRVPSPNPHAGDHDRGDQKQRAEGRNGPAAAKAARDRNNNG